MTATPHRRVVLSLDIPGETWAVGPVAGPDRWASDAASAEYANSLVLAFNAAGWVWQVTAVDRSGSRGFRAHLDGVTVRSSGGGVRIYRDDDGSGCEFPPNAPVEDVLAAATAHLPDEK